MNPEERHEEFAAGMIENIVKGALNMARFRFSVTYGTRVYNYKVYIQIWQDDDFDYDEFLEHCKKLTHTGVELNTNSYKAMADQLYRLLAADLPGRGIHICINQNDTGITIKYVR